MIFFFILNIFLSAQSVKLFENNLSQIWEIEQIVCFILQRN